MRESPDPSPSSSFVAICRWGRDVACLQSKVENVILSRDINAHLEKKLIDVDQGESQHWGPLFTNCELLGCVGWTGKISPSARFSPCKNNFSTDVLLQINSFLACFTTKCYRPCMAKKRMGTKLTCHRNSGFLLGTVNTGTSLGTAQWSVVA